MEGLVATAVAVTGLGVHTLACFLVHQNHDKPSQVGDYRVMMVGLPAERPEAFESTSFRADRRCD